MPLRYELLYFSLTAERATALPEVDLSECYDSSIDILERRTKQVYGSESYLDG